MKSNYENAKDRKYPHCIVVGLTKGPRKATKKSLKKYEEKIKELEGKGEAKATQLAKMKSLGVFIKTYNMAHLLVTRYSIKEDFGLTKSLEKLDKIEAGIKETQTTLNKKLVEKKDDKKEVEELKEKIGKQKDELRGEVRAAKSAIGKEMLSRFMEGFVRAKDDAENEKQEHTEFLFKKLNF